MSAPSQLRRFIIFLLLFFLSSPLSAKVAFQEDFSGGLDKEGMPKGWKLKSWSGNTHQVEIVEEEGKNILRLGSQKDSFGLYREFDFDSKSTPLLTWHWKVTRLPEGGDIRQKNKDDQAAQVYVMFPRFPKFINTRLVGYIWESSAPQGEKVISKKSSNTRYIVLQSGKGRLGEWMAEKRNVYEDYKDLFGEEPPKAGGITLMIDSDDTNSSAESYYSDIRIEEKE